MNQGIHPIGVATHDTGADVVAGLELGPEPVAERQHESWKRHVRR